jgi:hypothetical protein
VPDWSNHYVAYSNLKKQYVLHVVELGCPSISGTEADEQCVAQDL